MQRYALEFHDKIKPPGTVANAAVYLIEIEEIEHIFTTNKTYDFSTQIIQSLLVE